LPEPEDASLVLALTASLDGTDNSFTVIALELSKLTLMICRHSLFQGRCARQELCSSFHHNEC
jgi:hypothetical protein